MRLNIAYLLLGVTSLTSAAPIASNVSVAIPDSQTNDVVVVPRGPIFNCVATAGVLGLIAVTSQLVHGYTAFMEFDTTVLSVGIPPQKSLSQSLANDKGPINVRFFIPEGHAGDTRFHANPDRTQRLYHIEAVKIVLEYMLGKEATDRGFKKEEQAQYMGLDLFVVRLNSKFVVNDKDNFLRQETPVKITCPCDLWIRYDTSTPFVFNNLKSILASFVQLEPICNNRYKRIPLTITSNEIAEIKKN